MSNKRYCKLFHRYIMPVYRPAPVSFVRGEGAWLWDADGNRYLDFVAGIAVCSTGHCHPHVVKAIQRQAATLIHTSNLYCIHLEAELARRLTDLSFAHRCFFANSGAEANEAAIKLARRWAGKHKSPSARVIIAAECSFHGRTLATVTATGQEKYKKPFTPLPAGFRHVPYDDLAALAEAMDDDVCAVILEPIQGEAGVIVPSPDYLRGVRQLCDERKVLLILDEVQTGMGRTGRWFAHQHFDITPDIMTLAKALGSGVPIGACLASEEVASALEPGDHASTFGGNYIACAAALATIDVMQKERLVQRAARMGKFLCQRLAQLCKTLPIFADFRGLGLLLAVILREPQARALQDACRQRGLLVNAIGDSVIRLAPPLIVGQEEINQATDILSAAAQSL